MLVEHLYDKFTQIWLTGGASLIKQIPFDGSVMTYFILAITGLDLQGTYRGFYLYHLHIFLTKQKLVAVGRNIAAGLH